MIHGTTISLGASGRKCEAPFRVRGHQGLEVWSARPCGVHYSGISFDQKFHWEVGQKMDWRCQYGCHGSHRVNLNLPRNYRLFWQVFCCRFTNLTPVTCWPSLVAIKRVPDLPDQSKEFIQKQCTLCIAQLMYMWWCKPMSLNWLYILKANLIVL